MPATEREPGPHNTSAGRERTGSTGESVGSSFSASIGGKLRRTANGDVDVLHALGAGAGWWSRYFRRLCFWLFLW